MTPFTPEIAEQVCAHIAYGFSLRQIEKIEGMPTKRVILYWLFKAEVIAQKKEKTEDEIAQVAFLNQYAHAREAQADALAEEVLDISDDNQYDTFTDADGKVIVNNELVQRSRLRVDSRKWLAGKLRPKKYGDKMQNEISGPNGGDIPLSVTVSFVDARPDTTSE